MRIKTILPFVVTLVISIWLSAHAGEEPKSAKAESEINAEAKAKADYVAADEGSQGGGSGSRSSKDGHATGRHGIRQRE